MCHFEFGVFFSKKISTDTFFSSYRSSAQQDKCLIEAYCLFYVHIINYAEHFGQDFAKRVLQTIY